MRKPTRIGLVAFGITTCVLVPTTVRVLHAGHDQVVKLVVADEQTLQIGDARVDVTLDSGIVEAGGQLHVTVTASADKPAKVPLAVMAYEQEGMGDERMPNPPERIGRVDATLDVDGKASRTFAFTLPGFRAYGMDGRRLFGHYMVFVLPEKLANQYIPDGNDKTVARLDAFTRTTSNTIAIVSADSAQVGDIPVKIRVHNPTHRAFKAVSVSLSTEPRELRDRWRGIDDDQVFIGEPEQPTFSLAALETKVIEIHVHSEGTGTLGLLASVQCEGSADDNDCWNTKKPGTDDANSLDDSVLDAIDIVPAPAPEQGSDPMAKL